MSKRIILTPDKVTPTLYEKLLKLAEPTIQSIVVEVFKGLESRRKSYKLSTLSIKPHATEYYFPEFFDIVGFAGRQSYSIDLKKPEKIAFVRALVSLANAFGHDVHFDGMVDTLESVRESNLANDNLIEIVPEMVYAYTTQVKPNTLVLKLEYFFGTDVINILDAKGYEVNTGKERQNPERARMNAALQLRKRAEEPTV